MIIKYNQNPLWSEVTLSESESKELWYKLKIDDLMELLSNAEHYVDQVPPNTEKVKLYVESGYYYDEDKDGKTKIDKRIDSIHASFIEALVDHHIGDCVCYPCSCTKCWAEHLLGIETIDIGKHSANYILEAFTVDGVVLKDMPINQALDKLQGESLSYDELSEENRQKWEKSGGREAFDYHTPRWNNEKKYAYEWLLNYKQKHGF